jgi:type IV pilus modification protein PilV
MRKLSMHSPGHPARRSDRSQRGFGLIEVAIAIVVLAIGVLGLASLMPAGTRSAAQSGDVTRASELASKLAEHLLSLPWSNADLSSGTHDDSTYPWPGGYYVTYVVEDDQPIANCKRITITARWPSPTSANTSRLVIVNPRTSDQ